MITRLNIKDLVRNELSEQDALMLEDEYFNVVVNNAVQELQTDLLNLAPDIFSRTLYFSGSTVALPSDSSYLGNQIISMMVGTGVRDFISLDTNGTAERLTFTVKEPKATSNWTLSFTSAGTAVMNVTPFTVNILYNNGVTTHTNIINLATVSPVFTRYFITPTTTSGAATLNVAQLSVGFSLGGGSGTGWIKATPLSIEDKDNLGLQNSIFKIPSSRKAYYTVLADDGFIKQIQIFPETINFGIVTYRWMIKSVSDDTTPISIPELFEPHLYALVKSMCYQKLGQLNEDTAIRTQHMNSANWLRSAYKEMLVTNPAVKLTTKTEEPLTK